MVVYETTFITTVGAGGQWVDYDTYRLHGDAQVMHHYIKRGGAVTYTRTFLQVFAMLKYNTHSRLYVERYMQSSTQHKPATTHQSMLNTALFRTRCTVGQYEPQLTPKMQPS